MRVWPEPARGTWASAADSSINCCWNACMTPVIAEWNGDGKPDVVIPAAHGPIDIYVD